VARKVGIGRQELHRILKGEREPRAGLAIALFSAIEAQHNASIHYASEKEEWGTPDWLYDILNKTFKFTLDAAASTSDAKCKEFFDKETNGLKQCWSGHRVWVNPPYGKGPPLWCEKAYRESRENGVLVVLLLASRSSTSWWHDYVIAPGNQVIPIRGRIIFSGASNCAPFSSVIVIMPPWGKEGINVAGIGERISKARTIQSRHKKE